MNRDKLRAVLKQERPDLVEAGPAPPDDVPASDVVADVDDTAVPAATWARHSPPGANDMPSKIDKQKGLAPEDIRKTFAPRKLGTEQARPIADAPTPPDTADEPNIIRVVKRKGLAGAADSPDGSGPKAKDVLIDEQRGIIGSQG